MGRATVLVVEDDALVRGTVRDLLELEGMRVILARNGVEAHAMVEAYAPSAIVLDLQMPVAGGRQLVERLRRENRLDVPVILFSGTADLEAEARRLGATRWVRKPCPPEALIDVLREVLQAEQAW